MISLIALTAGVWATAGGDLKILSLSTNGALTWTNPVLNATCRVEWAASPSGPWFSSWESLSNIVVTNAILTRAVPMFYRISSSAPPAPIFSNLTAQATLAWLQGHRDDPRATVIDVRTSLEYELRHIRGALNLDISSGSFDAKLKELDRTKSYLVYCASGSRSQRAVDAMKPLGFVAVWNLSTGIGSLAALSGAEEFLEP